MSNGTEATAGGLTHHCDDPDCHVPGFVSTLTTMGSETEALDAQERAILRDAVCSCYSRPEHIAQVLAPAVERIIAARLARRGVR